MFQKKKEALYLNLIKKELLGSFGSLSHLWGFTTSGMLGYDENGEGIWKMCKDEGKLMGMAPDGYYDEKIYKIYSAEFHYIQSLV